MRGVGSLRLCVVCAVLCMLVVSPAAAEWLCNGTQVCTQPESQGNMSIVADGSGGAIMAWTDYRSGDYDIYAQLTQDWSGLVGRPPAKPVTPRAHPNPFGTSTTIALDLKKSTNLSVKIYDTSGRFVRMLADGYRQAGNHVLEWDGRDVTGRPVASGVYFLRIESPPFRKAGKIVLAR